MFYFYINKKNHPPIQKKTPPKKGVLKYQRSKKILSRGGIVKLYGEAIFRHKKIAQPQHTGRM